MNILVTGGAGMIGSNLVRRLLSIGHDVFVADNFWRGKKEYLLGKDGDLIIPKDRLFEVDLRNIDSCLKVTKDMDVVYHLADIVAGINFVFDNEFFIWNGNVLINTNTISAAIENQVSNYIYVGTACSYPKSKQSYLYPPPFKENDVYPAEPESAYGWSKLMGEYEVELAAKQGKINTGILRLHNVYGTPCELDPEKSQVIPALCRKAILYPDESFTVWGSGNQRRAFVHVDDVVNALVVMLDLGMNQGVIQIGPSESVSISEIASKIADISGKNISINFDLDRPEGDLDRTADWSRARNILGWKQYTSINSGLENIYAWCEKKILGRK